MKIYTNTSKILVGLALSVSLSACSFFTAPKYDNNELLLLAYFKTEIDQAADSCKTIDGKGRINTVELKRSYNRLNNYSKQTPSNEDYVKMLKSVGEIMKDLDKPEYSRVFCELKTKNLKRAAEIVSQSSALKF